MIRNRGILAACAMLTCTLPMHGGAAERRPFTARDLVMLDRISDPRISPDGARVLYGLRSTNLAANRATHALWILSVTGKTAPVRLPVGPGASDARWSPDGRSIFFLSAHSKSEQVWRADPAGSHAVQVTHLPLDVQTFKVAPDGKHVVVGLAVFPDCATPQCTSERQARHARRKASGTVYDRLFVRHWDTWSDGTKNHLFALALDRNGVASGTPVALMPAFDGDVPAKPFGGDEDFDIAPDGRTVVFSARLAGRNEPWSTNFDLWQVPIDGSKAPLNVTAENPAWDAAPVFSPDGSRLAYLAQRRPGFESDRFAVMVRDLQTGQTKEIAPSWDRSAGGLKWSRDGRFIFTTADDSGNHRLFSIDSENGDVKPLTEHGSVEAFDTAPQTIVYALSTLHSPAQVFAMPARGDAAGGAQLTHADAQMLAGVVLSTSERFEFSGWNGETVHGTVTKPYGYRDGQKYPVAFLIHGGPQGSWTDGWSYRWNAQTYAGQGYAVVTVDFHGSTGYGQAFTDSISRHWGDRPLEDLQKGWSAALSRYAFLDPNRACALGASYGGFMVDWIAGNWKAPWKCLVVHDGVFDNRMMGYSSEELWFTEWENGGTPWDHQENYERFNPIDHVADWSVPMLVLHSSNDFRIPIEQGIAAFTALQRKGIPSEFLTFPDENHWVLKPQNSLLWHDTVNAWLARWLK